MYFNKRKKNIYSNQLFRNVPASDLRLNFSSKYFKETKAREIIYLAGDESNSLFLVISGHVKLKFYGIGNELTVIDKFENDFFGENELVIEVPRKSIAVAEADSLLFQIRGKNLKKIRNIPAVRMNLSRVNGVLNTISRIPEKNLEAEHETQIKKAEYSNQMNKSNHFIYDKIKDESAEHFTEEDSEQRFLSEEIHKKKLEDQIGDELHKIGSEISDINGEETISLVPEEEIADDKSELIELTKVDDDNTFVVERLTSKEYHELSQKIISLVYDEIKMPLRMIEKYAHLLIRNTSSAEANKVLQNILNQSNTIKESFQNYSDFFNEKIKINTQPVLAENVLNDVLLKLADYTEFHGIKLFRKFEANASIHLDKNLFYEASLQIVKFLNQDIPEDGSIFVTIGRTSEFLTIEFKSNGLKFSNDLLNKIAEHFMLKEAPGLEFARKVIREHNGTMLIQNSLDGEPKVKISLPVVK